MTDGFLDTSTFRDEEPSEDERFFAADSVERYAIEYGPIDDAPLGIAWGLYEVTTPARAAIAARFAKHFHRETAYDFPPYEVGDERRENIRVFLIRSPRFGSLIPMAGGCVGLIETLDGWVVTWMWVHPLDRGPSRSDHLSLAEKTFDVLDREFGDLAIEGPLSKAMAVLAKRRAYPTVSIVAR